jgi:hypothetical protein
VYINKIQKRKHSIQKIIIEGDAYFAAVKERRQLLASRTDPYHLIPGKNQHMSTHRDVRRCTSVRAAAQPFTQDTGGQRIQRPPMAEFQLPIRRALTLNLV